MCFMYKILPKWKLSSILSRPISLLLGNTMKTDFSVVTSNVMSGREEPKPIDILSRSQLNFQLSDFQCFITESKIGLVVIKNSTGSNLSLSSRRNIGRKNHGTQSGKFRCDLNVRRIDLQDRYRKGIQVLRHHPWRLFTAGYGIHWKKDNMKNFRK